MSGGAWLERDSGYGLNGRDGASGGRGAVTARLLIKSDAWAWQKARMTRERGGLLKQYDGEGGKTGKQQRRQRAAARTTTDGTMLAILLIPICIYAILCGKTLSAATRYRAWSSYRASRVC